MPQIQQHRAGHEGIFNRDGYKGFAEGGIMKEKSLGWQHQNLYLVHEGRRWFSTAKNWRQEYQDRLRTGIAVPGLGLDVRKFDVSPPVSLCQHAENRGANTPPLLRCCPHFTTTCS